MEKVKRLHSCSPSSGLFVRHLSFVRQKEIDCFIRPGRALGGKGCAACKMQDPIQTPAKVE